MATKPEKKLPVKKTTTVKKETSKKKTVATPKKVEKKKILVVYYSRGGKCKQIAEYVSQKLASDIVPIIDKKKRGGVFGYFTAAIDSAMGKLTIIEDIQKNPTAYDLVVIGTPVWSYNISPAIRTFLGKYKDSLKQVAFFTMAGSTPPEKIVQKMEEISGKKAVCYAGFVENDFKNNKEKVEIKIAEFVGKLK